jgi:hypothetical protein
MIPSAVIFAPSPINLFCKVITGFGAPGGGFTTGAVGVVGGFGLAACCGAAGNGVATEGVGSATGVATAAGAAGAAG